VVELVPCSEEHRWLVFEWRNRLDVRRHMTTVDAIPRADHDAWYSRLLARAGRTGWVVLEDGVPVGAVFVADIDHDHRRGSLGIYLGDEAARGRGVGSAALFLVMEKAFEELSLHKLTCEVIAANAAARTLYDGFGFRAQGTLQDHLLRDGAFTDLDLLAAFEDDWPRIRAGAEGRLRAKGLVA
jgi:UDP-4-amino-4,6-dideoxy-N-acetyl-beta-L-altrosamine N-acetyltransferase